MGPFSLKPIAKYYNGNTVQGCPVTASATPKRLTLRVGATGSRIFEVVHVGVRARENQDAGVTFRFDWHQIPTIEKEGLIHLFDKKMEQLGFAVTNGQIAWKWNENLINDIRDAIEAGISVACELKDGQQN